MAELHAIEPEPLADEVLPLLDHLRELAEAGGISSIAVAVVMRDGTTAAKWTHAGSAPAMLGAISRLAHKVNSGMDE